MRVRMKTNIGGFRNGEPWPRVGECIDVPDHEAADLIHVGYAEEAPDADDVTPDAADDQDPAEADDDPADAGDDQDPAEADDDPADAGDDDPTDPVEAADAIDKAVKGKRAR